MEITVVVAKSFFVCRQVVKKSCLISVKRKKAILSDSEDEEEKDDAPGKSQVSELRPRTVISPRSDDAGSWPISSFSVTKKSRPSAGAENSDSDAAPDSPDKSMAAKLRELGSDSEEEDDRSKGDAGKKDEKNLFGSDSDSDDEEEWVCQPAG